MTQPIIGLMGYAQSGKDTAAEGLKELGFVRVAFADALKELALEIDPLVMVPTPEEWMPVPLSELLNSMGWEEAKKNPDVRQHLQNLGVGVRRVIDPDTWVQVAAYKVGAAHPSPVVISDVRFGNEIEWIRRVGGRIIRIERPGVGPVNDHVSEAEWTAYQPDLHIGNVGTVEEFQARVRSEVQAMYPFHGDWGSIERVNWENALRGSVRDSAPLPTQPYQEE